MIRFFPLFWGLVLSLASAVAQTKPNIILILADDLGYGDVGFNGQEKIKTPHLDRLAGEGLVFRNFYAGSAVCGPSRASMLTGLHTGHAGIRNNPSQAKDLDACDLQPEDNTIAKELKRAGYATGIYGKWGLDEKNGTDSGHPLNQGFDEFYGMLTHLEAHFHWPNYIWHNREKIDLGGKNNWKEKRHYADDIFTEKALAFMAQNAEQKQPFFTFLSYTIPHLGVSAPEASWAQYKDLGWPKGKAQGGHYRNDPQVNVSYAAMISHMDDYVAQIRAKLEALGIADNTVIVFTSDNGHEFDKGFFGSSGPYKGKKRDLYEGGMHVPGLIHWPAGIRTPAVIEEPFAQWDYLATFCELAGIEPSAPTNGISLVPLMTGRPERQKQHDYLYWEFNRFGTRPQQAARFGDWKIYRPAPTAQAELYNLATDPGERKNLAQQNPEVLDRGLKILANARTENPNFALEMGTGKKKKNKKSKK